MSLALFPFIEDDEVRITVFDNPPSISHYRTPASNSTPDNMVLSPDMQVTKEVRQPNVFSYNSEAVLIPNVTQCYLFQPAIPMCVLVKTARSKWAVSISKVKVLAID